MRRSNFEKMGLTSESVMSDAEKNVHITLCMWDIQCRRFANEQTGILKEYLLDLLDNDEGFDIYHDFKIVQYHDKLGNKFLVDLNAGKSTKHKPEKKPWFKQFLSYCVFGD